MSVFSLAYYSRSNLDELVIDTRVEIDKILTVARQRNQANELTGALMFNEDRFSQILEGDEEAVRAVFSSIERDPRHSQVTIISLGTVRHRHFAEWTMAFAGASPVAREYYKDYLSDQNYWHSLTGESIVQVMLKMISLDQSDPLMRV